MANTDISYVRKEEAPILPPPANEQGITGWLWHNIFQSMSNFSSFGSAIVSILMILLTVFFAYSVVMLVYLFANFVLPPLFDFHIGNWHIHLGSAVMSDPQGLEREVCNVEGAGMCYPYLQKWFAAHIYGNSFPHDERWRVNVVYFILTVSVIWLMIEKLPGRRWVAGFMLTLFPIISFVLLNGSPVLDGQSYSEFLGSQQRLIPLVIGLIAGVLWYVGRKGFIGDFGEAFSPVFLVVALIYLAFALIPILAGGLDAALGLNVVPTSKWGGLLVTLVVALTGIIFSLPIGVILALGRRSNMPLIKWLCVIFIEVVRGIPLILVLFFAARMLGFFLESGVTFNSLLKALIGVALFASAYMAEVVRGGLQAVPKGQYEGAMAMGLTYSQMMRLVVLPQALTIVIPGIVNTFIGLFKDTTLVLIISLFDLLGIGQFVALKDLAWAGAKLPYTEYVFIAVIFWVFCFGMSRYSMYMERKLARGHH